MIAFDTDVLSGIMRGHEPFLDKLALIPVADQAIPIVVIEEIMRGRLNMIRCVESGSSNMSLERAYELFERTFDDFQRVKCLSYTQEADDLVNAWRKDKLRLGTNDLKIAAICQVHGATLIEKTCT